MQFTPEKCEAIVVAAATLHNLLIEKRPSTYLQDVSEQPVIPGVIDLSWQCEHTLENLRTLEGNYGTRRAKAQRDHIKQYMNTIGSVPWQWDKI